jgi:transcriptional regulator with XRE-family HTH domain
MNKGTSNALDILRDEFGDDAELQEMLAEERVTAQAARAIYDARRAAGLTQQELAEMVGTHQPVIARLEDNAYEGHTLSMLARVAQALKLRSEFRFVSPEQNVEPDVQHALSEVLATTRDLQATVESLCKVVAQQQETISYLSQQTRVSSASQDIAEITGVKWDPNYQEVAPRYHLSGASKLQH